MSATHSEILAVESAARLRTSLGVGAVLAICAVALWITGFFDAQRFADGVAAILQLADEMFPPDFTRWQA